MISFSTNVKNEQTLNKHMSQFVIISVAVYYLLYPIIHV